MLIPVIGAVGVVGDGGISFLVHQKQESRVAVHPGAVVRRVGQVAAVRVEVTGNHKVLSTNRKPLFSMRYHRAKKSLHHIPKYAWNIFYFK